MKIPLPLPKGKPLRKNTPPPPGHDTLQRWLPAQGLSGGLLSRTDGSLAAVVRVEPAPFSLLSDREKERRVAALFEAVQSLPAAAQVLAVPRPIDLDAYLAGLEERLTEAEGSRKTILRGYLSYVRGLAAGAGAVERRFYVLIPGGEGRKKGGREELEQRAKEFVSALARAELAAHLCDEREILDLLFCFFHPAQAAFERPTEQVVAPVYLTARDVIERGVD